jgi:FeS assembly SUF system protein
MREEEPTNQRGEGDKPTSDEHASQETPPEASHGASPDAAPGEGESAGTMRVFEEDVVEALKHVYDPEIPINVYELGLIYSVYVSDNNDVHVEMTLTTPNCPEAENIPPKARGMIKKMVPGVNSVEINLVWDPPWTMEMMSEDAKLALGLF